MKIDELIKKDKTFTEANLLAKVDNIFIMLLSSIMVGNLDRVKHKLSNSLFNEYNLFLNNLCLVIFLIPFIKLSFVILLLFI